ncbi:MAG: P-type conjugative transfer ATPase TrbB, partial [Janthinobacterium lividum]
MPEAAPITSREETARRLADTLKRQLGLNLCNLLQTPGVVELLLNADGRVWVDRLRSGMEPVGEMTAPAAESFIGTVASTLKTTVNRESPILECELPLAAPFNGARFEAVIPPNVSPGPVFSIRLKAASVFTLDQYVEAGIMTPSQCA